MERIRDLLIPCAKKLDEAFHQNMEAAKELREKVKKSPHIMRKIVIELRPEDFKEAANCIKGIVGIERRSYAR